MKEQAIKKYSSFKYEFEPKKAVINLRLPENLLAAIKAKAAKDGLPYTRFIRMILEKAI